MFMLCVVYVIATFLICRMFLRYLFLCVSPAQGILYAGRRAFRETWATRCLISYVYIYIYIYTHIHTSISISYLSLSLYTYIYIYIKEEERKRERERESYVYIYIYIIVLIIITIITVCACTYRSAHLLRVLWLLAAGAEALRGDVSAGGA